MLKLLRRCILFLLIACVSCTKKDIFSSHLIEIELRSYYELHTNNTNRIFEELNFEIDWSNYSITSQGDYIVPINSTFVKNGETLIGKFELYFEYNSNAVDNILYRYISPKNKFNQQDYILFNLNGQVLLDEQSPFYWILHFANSHNPHYYLAPLQERYALNDEHPDKVQVHHWDDYHDSDVDNFNPYSIINCSYEPDSRGSEFDDYTYEYGGAGNLGKKITNANSDVFVSLLILAPVKEIILTDRFKCFQDIIDNANTKYSVILHVDKTNNFGHAFLTIEKSNGDQFHRLSYGFYPKTTSTFLTITSTIFPTNSAIGEETEDGQRVSDIRYIVHLAGSYGKYIFNKILNKSLKDVNNPYILTEYNCTNYAIAVFNEALKDKINNTNFYLPSDLYNILKIMQKKGNDNIVDMPIYRESLARSTKCG